MLQKPFRIGNTGQRQRAGHENVPDQGHVSAQPAHLAHIAGSNGMDHRPGARNSRALKTAVAEQVELARKDAARANRIHHITQLADG